MKKRKIVILCPKAEFSKRLQKKLSGLGELIYAESRDELGMSDLKKLAKGAVILAVDPDILGGWVKVETKLRELIKSLPQLKGLALDTTAFHYVDFDQCRKRTPNRKRCFSL